MMEALFRRVWDSSPTLWARAPGRVDLMGSHTDYNLGYVLTLPISRDVRIAAAPRTDRQVRIHSANLQASACFSLDQIQHDEEQPWSNYVRGVASVLQREGFDVCGFDGVLHGTVPIGSGLSSSAALECATAVVFRALGGWELDAKRMARLCQRAENEFAGVSCGILDQFSSCLGQSGCALLLDCRDLSTRPVEMDGGIRAVICDTKSPRQLTGSEYGIRRAQCEEAARLLGVAALRDATIAMIDAYPGGLPAEAAKRARFIVEESARAPLLAEALTAGDAIGVGRLCSESFRGACDLYEIASPAMVSMMRAMRSAPAVLGARQAGAGFGGCMVAFVESECTGRFAQSVRADYLRETGIDPEIYSVEAADGAGLLPC